MNEPIKSASVISTGAAGTVFEHYVGASFLCSLLTGSYLPIFSQASPVKVHFQANRLGWHTDDLLIEGIDSSEKKCRLFAQVKRSFTISENDKECKKVFRDAWLDFKNDSFNQLTDAIVLIVHIPTQRISRDFVWLLEQARASFTLDDFLARFSGSILLNKKSKKYYKTIKSILSSELNTTIPDLEFWQFLRIFHLISYDFTSQTAKDEMYMKTFLSGFVVDGTTEQISATWSELISLAAQAASKGQSFTRKNLPSTIQNKYSEKTLTEQKAIADLKEHSEIILRRITDYVGPSNYVLDRMGLVNELKETVPDTQITLIIGAAGSGKSVLAKQYVQSIMKKGVAFVFASEEFRAPHIDQVLSNAQINTNWRKLSSLLALQSEKVVLIESVERLLESDDRGAITDLINTVVDDPSFRLIITCRDYHAETVERTMLQRHNASYKRVFVPDLTDEELEYVLQAYPILKVPCASLLLKKLLRNPFILALAASIEWKEGQPLPLTERALRECLWRDIVCKDSNTREALPRRRAEALKKVALDRARSLRPYVEQKEGDKQAIEALAADNLIAFDSSDKLRMAPAHDVFEDWALVEWLSDEFASVEKDASLFASGRDSYPALRRAYRKWLHELIEGDHAIVSSYLTDVISNTSIADYLRDDTVVAIFQSTHSKNFLLSFGENLIKNNAEFLCRAIHLVRVACKTLSSLALDVSDFNKRWHVPAGHAWENLLEFIDERWSELPSSVYPLILAFMEDWARGVNYIDAYPSGASSVGSLLQKILPTAQDGWRGRSEKERIFSLIVKIPKANEQLFKELIFQAKILNFYENNRDIEVFVKTFLKPFQTFAASRDYPDEVISLCNTLLTLQSSDQNIERGYQSIDTDVVFGIKNRHALNYFPQSAHQGPFRHLLMFHPVKAIHFIVSLMNHAADYYGEGKYKLSGVELPEQISIVLPDGKEKKIWANSRLWNAYRGTSVMPNVLICALMALEEWLLEMFQEDGVEDTLQKWLNWILLNSNNAALISVAASICIAYPKKTGDIGLFFFRTPEFIHFDRHRFSQETMALAVGGWRYEEKLFQEERATSNQLIHRRKMLEHLAMDLQLGAMRDKMWEILDEYYSDLPSIDSQDDSDRLWRLCLRRMDFRKYQGKKVTEDGYVEVELESPEDDIQEMLNRREGENQQRFTDINLFLWANNQFDRIEKHLDEKTQWPQYLSTAIDVKEIEHRPDTHYSFAGPVFVAVVCVRDHWEEMEVSEQNWCVEKILSHIFALSPGDGRVGHGIRDTWSGLHACAFVLPFILINWKDGQDEDVLVALIALLLHSNQEVRYQVIQGFSECVFEEHHDLVIFCIKLLIEEAAKWNEIKARWRIIPHFQRGGLREYYSEVFDHVVDGIKDDWGDEYPDIEPVRFETFYDRLLIRELILFFKSRPTLPQAQDYFMQISQVMSLWWTHDFKSDRDQSWDYSLVSFVEKAFAEFLMASDNDNALRLAQTFRFAVLTEPDEVADLVLDLILLEDRVEHETPFWDIWKAFAQEVVAAKWLINLDDEHAIGQKLIRHLFFNIRWKEGIRSWVRLEESFQLIDDLFVTLPNSVFLLTCYSNYLYHVGEKSLPNALFLISNKFGATLGESISKDSNTLWYLDALVSRVLYEDLKRIKETPRLRIALMSILDALVQAGSSVAFQLRDDFVTPTSMSLIP